MPGWELRGFRGLGFSGLLRRFGSLVAFFWKVFLKSAFLGVSRLEELKTLTFSSAGKGPVDQCQAGKAPSSKRIRE